MGPFEKLKNCPGCARRRARLAAWLEGLKVAAAEVLPAFRSREEVFPRDYTSEEMAEMQGALNPKLGHVYMVPKGFKVVGTPSHPVEDEIEERRR